MPDILDVSADWIDNGRTKVNPQRLTTQLSEVADGIGYIEAFSNVVAFDSDDGLALFDTSLEVFAQGIMRSLRKWSGAPVHTIAYTHGHIDHVGGAHVVMAEAREKKLPPPQVIGHENVAPRIDRYIMTNGYNAAINARQFLGAGNLLGGGRREAAGPNRFGPQEWIRPDTIFRDRLAVRVGHLSIEMRHEKGETDDHLWAWIPEHKAICAGDFVTWVFPNAGNPQKVQRYPLEWAHALREMQAFNAELLLPAHGLPVGGVERVRQVLDDLATALEMIVEQTLAMINDGAPLDAIIHSVTIPETLLEKPYMRPVYDEPEFIVHNIWRLYGGWYEGNPAKLKPAPLSALAHEVARLAGGVGALIARARELADAGELRLACELVEIAVQADEENTDAHGARAEIYAKRVKAESSVMARGVFNSASQESAAKADSSKK